MIRNAGNGVMSLISEIPLDRRRSQSGRKSTCRFIHPTRRISPEDLLKATGEITHGRSACRTPPGDFGGHRPRARSKTKHLLARGPAAVEGRRIRTGLRADDLRGTLIPRLDSNTDPSRGITGKRGSRPSCAFEFDKISLVTFFVAKKVTAARAVR